MPCGAVEELCQEKREISHTPREEGEEGYRGVGGGSYQRIVDIRGYRTLCDEFHSVAKRKDGKTH